MVRVISTTTASSLGCTVHKFRCTFVTIGQPNLLLVLSPRSLPLKIELEGRRKLKNGTCHYQRTGGISKVEIGTSGSQFTIFELRNSHAPSDRLWVGVHGRGDA